MIYSLNDFDYKFDKKLIAKYPLKERDESRLLYYSLRSDEIREYKFKDILNLFNKNDLLILNDTKVVKARMHLTDERGRMFELLFIRMLDEEARKIYGLVFPARKLKKGLKLYLDKDNYFEFVERDRDGGHFIFNFQSEFYETLERFGEVPLPPYIDRKQEKGDEKAYQTVFAKIKGSVAAPTAGLHFSNELLSMLTQKGVNIGYITLAVGPATFLPIRKLDQPLQPEVCHVPYKTIELIKSAVINRTRICPVGTTSLRCIESITRDLKEIKNSLDFETSLFIKPGWSPRFITSLITNFHLPKSSLFILVCSLIGIDKTKKIYNYAINKKYRFYSYGDACFFEL
ncbi:MAG: tRNA preQ1(34) S-adenosylmethionine ribosyltransferase-isomerase QueA [Candidatus Hydrogenedentota bacterium]